MFNLNKSNSPLASAFEMPVYQKQQQSKNLENRYFSEEYDKMINQKAQRQQEQRRKKRQQMELYNRKNRQYLDQVAMGRQIKMHQKQYMADQYQEMIKRKKERQITDKKHQKSFQRDLLDQNSWVRDQSQQRYQVKARNNHYSRQLQQHVRLQQMRKSQQVESQKKMRQKINEQAQMILQKQYQQLQQRHKRKSMFQQRQNQLLGIRSPQNYDSEDITSSRMGVSQDGKVEEISLKKRQKQIYGRGLDYQRHSYEQNNRRKRQPDSHFHPHNGYNPITNPLPLVYKNPNVLRMLSQR